MVKPDKLFTGGIDRANYGSILHLFLLLFDLLLHDSKFCSRRKASFDIYGLGEKNEVLTDRSCDFFSVIRTGPFVKDLAYKSFGLFCLVSFDFMILSFGFVTTTRLSSTVKIPDLLALHERLSEDSRVLIVIHYCNRDELLCVFGRLAVLLLLL